MFPIQRNGKIPIYEQIYNGLRDDIETGILKAGSRLLSVRRFAETYGVSKITVEQAYGQLAAEGYIKAHNRAPYEVLPIFVDGKINRQQSHKSSKTTSNKSDPFIKYNFATGDMDPEGFDYKRWKKLINFILREPEELMSYGEEEGEEELREAIAKYLYDSRGVNTTANNIVIAAGTQILLHIIMSLLLKSGLKKINIASREQQVLTQAFIRDRAVNIIDWDTAINSNKNRANVLYCTPSHSDHRGGVLSIGERLSLLKWAQENDSYIIEDDYDSELRYLGRPISAMHGLDKDGAVIYIGSVSKVLPPSIRISFMVLPADLYKIYQEHISMYRQTAGVLEQLVLAEYINRGEWSKQIRRLRKHYQEKSKYMVSLLKKAFGDKAHVTNPAGGVYVCLTLHSDCPVDELIERAEKAHCSVRFAEMEEGNPTFLLSFSSISTNKLQEAVNALATAWKGI